MSDTNTTAPTATTTVQSRASKTVQLETPIARSGSAITELQVMKPRTGDLRGLALTEVLQMRADALALLLPRITVPTLTKQEIAELDPADLVSCGVEVATFLVPKAAMESLPA